MGRITRDEAAYRDDPDAVSLHTTPDDFTYDDAPEISGLPPAYTDSEADVETGVLTHAEAELTMLIGRKVYKRINHNEEVHLSGDTPKVSEQQVIMSARFDSDPVFLERGIRQLQDEPPILLIYIMGRHKETTKKGDKKETKHVTDFRLVLNMQKYLCDGQRRWVHNWTVSNDTKAYRGGCFKTRAPGVHSEADAGKVVPSLKEWCHLYCASPAYLRTFRLQRNVVGLDKEYLKGQIEGLIRSTNYRGKISVTFPVEDQYIDFYTATRVNQWRFNFYITWFFYLTFLWIFSWPYLFFATKRWNVLQSDWTFSRIRNNREWVVMSEEEWFTKFSVGIKRLVLDRFQGEASDEMMIGVMERPSDPPMPGTFNTGNANIDTAASLLTQGFQVARSIQTGRMDRGLQGGWGYDC